MLIHFKLFCFLMGIKWHESYPAMENLLNQYGSSHSTTREGRNQQNQQINWEYQPIAFWGFNHHENGWKWMKIAVEPAMIVLKSTIIGISSPRPVGGWVWLPVGSVCPNLQAIFGCDNMWKAWPWAWMTLYAGSPVNPLAMGVKFWTHNWYHITFCVLLISPFLSVRTQ